MSIFTITSEITWFFNRKKIEQSSSILISKSDTKSKITVNSATNEHVGFYSCKAKNEVGEAVTLGKFEIASTTGPQEVSNVLNVTESYKKISKNIVNQEKIIENVTKQNYYEKIENENMTIQHEVQLSIKEVMEERIESIDYANILNDPELLKVLEGINKDSYGPGLDTIKELSTIEFLMKRGSTIDDIKNIYNINGFVALKQPESQFALVQFIEKAGHGKLITEILIAEHVADDELLASTVGFLALLKLIEMNHTTIENVICQLSHEDFTRQDWKSMEGKEVLPT